LAQRTKLNVDNAGPSVQNDGKRWWRRYADPVPGFYCDVKPNDSLVSPYIGTYTYTEVFYITKEHNKKEQAERDNKFKTHAGQFRSDYYYQEGKWVHKDDYYFWHGHWQLR